MREAQDANEVRRWLDRPSTATRSGAKTRQDEAGSSGKVQQVIVLCLETREDRRSHAYLADAAAVHSHLEEVLKGSRIDVAPEGERSDSVALRQKAC